MLRGIVNAAVAVALACAVGCGVSVSSAEVALLGEMVPWPMQCAAITGGRVQFTERPTEEIAWSGGIEPIRYALLPLGNAADLGITVLEYAQPGGPPLLLLDEDNDEDLDNNAWLHPDERNGPRSYTWFPTVTVEYGQRGPVVRHPYRISVHGAYSYESEAYEFFYSGYSHRQGVVTIDGERYAIGIASLGSTGCYDDLQSLVAAIDIDRDGELDTLPYSHEVFGPAAPIVLPTGTYSIFWANAEGSEFHLRRVDEGFLRPTIARGESAPSFDSESIRGERIAVPAEDGRITILMFIHRVTASSGAACSAPSLLSWDRIEDVRAALSHHEQHVALVVVVEEQPPAGFRFEDGFGIPVSVVCDPAVNELYRRSVGAFVIDVDGVIVAMDETWLTTDCLGRPRGAYEELRGLDIRAVVDGLLRQ